MPWPYLVAGIVGAVVFGVPALYWLAKHLKREPYASFTRLRTRHKLRFFRLFVALIMRWTPRTVTDDLLRAAQE
jgi:hypothetical protein